MDERHGAVYIHSMIGGQWRKIVLAWTKAADSAATACLPLFVSEKVQPPLAIVVLHSGRAISNLWPVRLQPLSADSNPGFSRLNLIADGLCTSLTTSSRLFTTLCSKIPFASITAIAPSKQYWRTFLLSGYPPSSRTSSSKSSPTTLAPHYTSFPNRQKLSYGTPCRPSRYKEKTHC